MKAKAKVIQKAYFNPDIKKYLLIYGILILAITIVGIPLLLLWVPIAPYFIGKYFDRLECELTTRSLRFQKGFIFHTEKNIPLDKIQDLTFKEGPLLKAFGLSVLKIETASSNPQAGSDLTLIGIVGAAEFRQKVLEQRDIVTENIGSGSEEDSETLQVLKEIRNSLQRLEQKLG
ncbi:PH domain-containing protein [Aliifodinibius sp. S!AR15-10]|uniref:PH domain-containing protein n=1 Tax=Aliifodinibius sp. S!AR15-10 TaxID=2950437 RepID=UPI00285582E9|nr:PH domain-containing protein [Aliifodinibius sp. S!AR15-10]MDR8391540.1 PH domain-containing protein [Aliifodinibius sp. S!AR15-10]